MSRLLSSMHRSTGAPLAGLLAVLAVGPAMPAAAQTPKPVTIQTASSIDEGLFVSINGVDQWITIRGRDVRNPVLLVLHGGPGMGLSNVAPMYAAWEKDYTVVQWDQPGTGATYARNLGRDAGPLTIERYVRDGIAVARWSAEHLKVPKVALIGFSWGSILGVEMAQRRPDLFSAYIGSAQVVSGARGTMLGYRLALDAARKRGDAAAVQALEAGPPPYTTLAPYLVRQRYVMMPTSGEATKLQTFIQIATAPPPPDARYIARNLPQYDVVKLFMETFEAVYREQLAWEAPAHGVPFKLPVFIFQGAEDLNTPTALAMEYCAALAAPVKACATIPGAGHNTAFFTDEILALLDRHVRPVLGN